MPLSDRRESSHQTWDHANALSVMGNAKSRSPRRASYGPTSASERSTFGGFARSQPPRGEPRPEWPRHSFSGLVRSRSRGDSLRGPGCAGCTEVYYIAPAIFPRKVAGLPVPLLLLLFTLASRSLLRSPGPGLSFRGIAQWSRTRAVTCVTAESRCSSWNSHLRHCITLAYFLMYYHPVIRHPQP